MNHKERTIIHFSALNRSGSVEHYYHFLLGLLVPLCVCYDKIKKREKPFVLLVRSCGILDRHILEIGLPGIDIIDRKLHEEMIQNPLVSGEDIMPSLFVHQEGYDAFSTYSFNAFHDAKSLIMEQLSVEIVSITRELEQQSAAASINIVLIDREAPDPYYATNRSEIRSAGTERRSIPNFRDLASEISTVCPNTFSVTLMKASLSYQIALFMFADLIVAQHGAALTNLIWCKQGTHVIEIMPVELQQSVSKVQCFKRLAETMELNYHFIE